MSRDRRALSDVCQATIDWLELSVKLMSPGALLERMGRFLGEGFGASGLVSIDRDDEVRYLARGPHGVRVLADRVGQVNRFGSREPWAGVRLPGQACRAAGTVALLNLIQDLIDSGWSVKVSRLDLALDDFTHSFTPRNFAQACVEGDLADEKARLSARAVTRVGRRKWDWSRREEGCFWLGGRSSDRLLRVYDKEAESDGAIPSLRLELQNRNHYAMQAASNLLLARKKGRPLSEVVLDHLVGFIDLREPRGSRTRSGKWPRLPWWEAFVGRAKAATTPSEDPSDARTWVSACSKQSAGFLAVMLQSEGVSPKDFAEMVSDEAAPGRAIKTLRRIFGSASMPALSPEHRERLRQLRVAREQAPRTPVLSHGGLTGVHLADSGSASRARARHGGLPRMDVTGLGTEQGRANRCVGCAAGAVILHLGSRSYLSRWSWRVRGARVSPQ